MNRLLLFILLCIISQSTLAAMQLKETRFHALPGWEKENYDRALLAFKQSCTEIKNRPSQAPFSPSPFTGRVYEWQRICQAADHVNTKKAAKQFFEYWFKPYRVQDTSGAPGLFTGYYLPLIHASLTKTKHNTVPIYGVPNDLVKLPAKTSQKLLVRQFKQGKLLPYPDREAINHGAISKTAPVIAWTNDVVDLFFAQIQGSAIVELPNKQRFLLGYASGNGQPYTSIGKLLVDRGAIVKEQVSMRTIKTWLKQHPQQKHALLNQNASYVFFHPLSQEAPTGTERVNLTPGHSLAVDTRFIPLGAPLWLDTTVPAKKSGVFKPYRHIVIAQDTGGAINGIIRGDVYWGAGERAAFYAGEMKSSGEYFIFLPRKNS